MRTASRTAARSRSIFIALALISASSGLTSCGSDTDSDTNATPASTEAAATAATETAETGSTDTNTAAPAFDPAAYCTASLAIEVAPGPDIDFATATREQMITGMKAYATDTLLPLLEDIAKVAPPELGTTVSTFRTQLQKLAETGDPSVFSDPQFEAAGATAHAFDLATCKWNTVNVELQDYSFGGAPAILPAGVVNVEVRNTGKEIHELIILRRNDEVIQPFDEILELPQSEAQKLVSPAGGLQGTVDPSRSDYLIADLTPGTYAFVCFLPKGSTSSDAMDDAAPDAPSHAILGMVHEFTVE